MVTNSLEYMRKYYNEHKIKIRQSMMVKIPCEYCNIITAKNHMSRHHKTKKCLFIQGLKDI